MKKIFIALSVVFMTTIMLPTMVFAEDVDLNTKLTDEGDSIELDSAQTYTCNSGCTINKNVTINGNGATIKGKINITGDVEVTLNGVTIVSTEDGANILTVGNSAKLTVLNSEIYYKDKSDSDYGDYGSYPYGTVGIYVSGDSTVKVENTEVHAKYGIWIKGSDNNVTVSASKIHGYAAVDLSNSGEAASNNNVTIMNDSELVGHNIYSYLSSGDNNYGTVIVKDQENSNVTIENSTVSNSVSSDGNKEDLILYSNSEGNTVEVTDSELNNTDSNSSVFGLEADEMEGLSLILSGNTITGTEFPTEEGYVYVTLVVGDDEIVEIFDKDTVKDELPEFLVYYEDVLKLGNIKVDGYYADADYEEEFDFSTIAGNVKIYVKTSEIQKPAADTSATNTTKPPKTGDINLVVIASIIATALAGLFFAKKKISVKGN